MFAGLIVALVFCLALLVSTAAAHLYGRVFLKPPRRRLRSSRRAPPFWTQPMVWMLAALALILALLVRRDGSEPLSRMAHDVSIIGL